MMNGIKKYHLYKDDYKKLHFDIQDALPYCVRNKQHCYKPHLHSFYQLIWFKNKGHHYVDYEVIEHKANTLFFLNTGQVHHFCDQASNDGTLYHFDELFLNEHHTDADYWLQYYLFSEIGHPYVQLSEQDANDLSYLTDLMRTEIKHKSSQYRKQLYHLFQTLLLRIERLKQNQHEALEHMDRDFIAAMDFKKLIRDNMDQFLNISEYSQQLGVSSKKLTAVSKQYLKDTPANVISQQKILAAKRTLSNHKISIKETAYSLGFDQATYFTKYFKKHTGITPKDFIALLQ